MAAAAPTGASHEVLHTTHKKANFQRIARLLVAGGTALMREIFDQYFNTPLQFHLKLNVPFVKNNIKRAKLTKPQMDCLYPKTGTCNKNSKDFDISLLHKLFKTICNLNPPASGWDAFPPPADHSKAADLTRIKQYRNKIFHDYSDMEMDDTEFNSLWNDIREALLRLARSISPSTRSAWERAIEKLYTAPLTPEDESKVRELEKMYENEVRSKEEIKNIEKALQVGLDSVHQAIKRTGDDVHQAMQKGFSGLHQAIKETMMKNFHPIVEKKNDSGTSPQLTESALVGRAQNGNFPANRRAPALCKPSTLGTDPHLPEAGLSTPPERMLTATLTPSEFIKANCP